jgi:predicted nucleic acid-binding protein
MTPLADTNIVSEFTKRRANPGVTRWLESIAGFFISAMTLEELQFGLAHKPVARTRHAVERFIEERCTVLPVTPEIARRAGELRGTLRAQGQVRHQADMLIAATAQVHSLTLVTRNVRDFEGLMIPLLNPFAGAE